MTQISLTSSTFHNDIHAITKRMRQDDPVVRGKVLWNKAWFVSRYGDVDQLLRSDALVKEAAHVDSPKRRREMWLPKTVRKARRNILLMDDPEHRRLRLLVQQAFTRSRVHALDGSIRTIAHRLVDDMVQQGRCDFLQTFATPLPVQIIADMVGVPVDEQPRFYGIAQRVLQAPSVLGAVSQVRAIGALLDVVGALAEQRRRDPRDDLMTALVQAESEGAHLSDDEVQAMVLLLLTAGYETTRGLISNGMMTLLRHPDALAHLQKTPDALPVAIEEMLRFESPLLSTELYYAKREVRVADVDIRAGDMVVPLLLSANRDATKFDSPDVFDIERQPNPHLAFGLGIHYCLGAPLARLEAKVAFEVLFERLSELALVDVDQLRWANLLITHGLQQLPVRVQAA